MVLNSWQEKDSLKDPAWKNLDGDGLAQVLQDF